MHRWRRCASWSLQHEILDPKYLMCKQESETFDASVEAVCELVYCTASGGQPEAPMLPLVQRLVPAVRCGLRQQNNWGRVCVRHWACVCPPPGVQSAQFMC